jgi:hypothetical protein
MRPSTFLLGMLCALATARGAAAPSNAINVSGEAKQDGAPAEKAASQSKRLTIEVTGGEKNVAVADASVYLKYEEARVLRKDKKYALNVKTNREGATHIPDVPLGRVLIQVVADGWKTFGQYYEITDPTATIKIHLDRPPKWY